MDLAIPANDGTIEGQRRTADAIRRRAKAANTIRAYRAGVQAWCAYAARHGVRALPADPDDVKAFLVDQREPLPPGKPLALTTLRLRASAIGYMHRLARLPPPSQAVEIIETLTGYRRASNELPRPKRALRLELLAAVVAAIGTDALVDLRDRAILLLGFAGALRRSELAALEARHVEILDTFERRGLRLTLPRSKGDRAGLGAVVVIPAGTTALCPLAAYQAWIRAAGIAAGPVFRRVQVQPRPRPAPDGWTPAVTLGTGALDDGTIARIVKARARHAGLDPSDLAGHSLKRGALNTAADHGAEPAAMKRLGRHKSYATLAQYLEERESFEDGALKGLY
ncbi:MAG: site-specific integrase [Proteobacteria bacterium]|nr:site-specific integrase [Pseudomonadota bacterium]